MISQEEMIRFAREAWGFRNPSPSSFLPLRGEARTGFLPAEMEPKDSAILVHYDPKRMENTYYADIAAFLREIHVPVPRLIRHDPARCLILMEDLGDTDLWSLRKTPWETRRALYQKTLTIRAQTSFLS